MQIPDNDLYKAAVIGAITELNKWWNWERTGDNSGSIAASLWRGLILDTLTIDECKVDRCYPVDSSGSLPQCIKIGTDSSGNAVIDIYECEEQCMAVINVYEGGGCGCGCGSTGSGGTSGGSLSTAPSSPPLNIPNSVGNADYGGFTTLCDALSVLPAYIIDAVDDFLDRLQSGLVVVTVDQEELIPIINSLDDSISEVQLELHDEDFLPIIENNIVKSFNDPWTPLTRQDLRNFAYRFPIVFGGAPMWGAFVLWANFASLNAINSAVQAATGTGNASFCEGVFARVGRTQYKPPTSSSGTATLSYSEGGVDYNIYVTLANMPLRTPPNEHPPFSPLGATTAIGGGIAVSSIVGDSPFWKQARLMGDNVTFFITSSFDGQSSWISTGKDLAQITQGGWDNILEIVAGYVGNFTANEEISATTRVMTDGEIVYQTPQLSIPAENGATVDWVFVVTR